MDSELQWIITRVDGKIASVDLDYNGLMRIASVLSGMRPGLSKSKRRSAAAKARGLADSVTTEKVSTDELFRISAALEWEDLRLFGTEFQIGVWRHLFELNHHGAEPKLLSYSEFATICGNRPGIRAVAHAVGLNPIPVIIPCHWIIPKESTDRIAEIGQDARSTIFKGTDIWIFDSIDFGQYALGTDVKRHILGREFSYGVPNE
ncbi:MAG: methylated-DNA--[protein]-cysteine S-methyltransferase [Bacteroidales bacterium]|nr:methylated-DNA--[protein]-cysteine S-methyltransferase [Bacteroidales bacterium]